MSPEEVCAILNELLAAEEAAITPRLFESTVFVSQLATAQVPVAQRVAWQSRRNRERLTTLILQYGGVPHPRHPAANVAHLHFLDLHHVLPLTIEDHEMLIRKYEAASKRLASEPPAARPLTAILNKHREDLAELTKLHEQSGQMAAPGRA